MDRQQEFLKHFLRHQDDLRAFIASVVRDRHAREDILQDVALVLWQKFEQYDPNRSFGAWARGIAANKIFQSFAKSRKTPLPLSPEAVQAIVSACEDIPADPSDQQEALRRCLDKLPDKSRNLVRMRYEESLKLKDIAERVAGTLDAVHKALSRIRDGLRGCMDRELGLG